MHYLSHLSLLLMMFILEIEIAGNDYYIADWDSITEHNTKPSVEFSRKNVRFNYNPVNSYKRAIRHLASEPAWTSFAADHEEEHHDEERAFSDMTLFYGLLITHSLCFSAMIAGSIAKKFKMLEIPTEFFRNVICSFLYISIIIYCIFKDRLVEDDYTHSVTNDRVQQWILYEIGTFFCWLISSALFLQYLYWSKFTSVWKS